MNVMSLDNIKIIKQKLGEEMGGNVSTKIFNFQSKKVVNSVKN